METTIWLKNQLPGHTTELNHKTINELFEIQVAKTPNQIALVCAEKSITYHELNAKANQLAKYLQEQYKKKHLQFFPPETLIAIMMERSIEMLVAILAILKAGGAYLPIDPKNPLQRIQFLLQDSQTNIVITQSNLLVKLPTENQSLLDLILLDSDWSTIARYSQANLNIISQPKHLMYVIYTSGSTGLPKGVLVEQSSVMNVIAALKTALEFKESDILLSLASFSFDISVIDFYLPLLCGARLVLVDSTTIIDPEAIIKIITEQRISVMQLTPSGWELLLNANWKNDSDLKILCTGEALSNQLAKRLITEQNPIWNLYGPTEATIWSTAIKLSTIALDSAFASIGTPLPNVQVYVLDSNKMPVPINIIGELYIGGVGLARGYLNRPELTDKCFIANPFSDDNNERLYKTGDLVRWLPDRTLEYIGRNDDQIKIRGFRVELGEIESQLHFLPEIQKCVVLAQGSGSNMRLIAFLVFKEGKSLPYQTLRSFLEEFLPDYMVPSVFIALDRFPLTLHGKLDKMLLAQKAQDFNALSSDYTAASSPIEQTLIDIWTKVLKPNQLLGIHDDFFVLGGHSLLAFQAILRIKASFKLELDVTKIFAHRTVARLAEYIQHIQQLGISKPQWPTLTQDNHTIAFELSFAQKRFWLLDHIQPGNGAYNIPIALRLFGKLSINALNTALRELIARHPSLRTYFNLVNGVVLQKICSENELNFSLLSGKLNTNEPSLIESKIDNLVMEEIYTPFNLQQGPLLRAKLYHIYDEDHLLLITFHHIIFDGWSLKIFYQELTQCYSAALAGESANLSPITIQYTDFSSWERLCFQGYILEQQTAYWKGQLDNCQPLQIHTDYPRSSLQSFEGKTYRFTLNHELTKAIKGLCHQQKLTLYMVLLSGFYILLHRYSNQQDLLIGTSVAGRNHNDIENLIGCFINTLALRIKINADTTVNELLHQVKTITLQAYDHQYVPFELITEHVNIQKNTHYPSLFPVWFVLENSYDEHLDLKGLSISRIQPKIEIAKFDLSLHVIDNNFSITGQFIYPKDLFQEETIEQMARHWQLILQEITNQPTTKLSELSLLTEFEKKVLIGKHVPITDQTVGEIFEQQAACHHDRTAIHSEKYQWTYAELDKQANLIRDAIHSYMFPEPIQIALLLAHDAPMIASMLGTLKSGNIYVPLNISYPLDYLRTIIVDAEVKIIIADQQHRFLAQALALRDKLTVMYFENLPKFEGSVIPNKALPDNYAYLIYTSGSTGKPKAILQNQRNMLHFNRVYTQALQITAEDKLSLLASFNFDAAIMDIFGALLNGATLYSCPPKKITPEEYTNWLQHCKISIYHSTPTLFRYIFRSLEFPSKVNSLRAVVLGGEAVEPADIDLYSQHCSDDCIFINGYGPTESTISTQYFLQKKVDKKIFTVPIGAPVANTQILLLNSEGIPGQIIGEIGIQSPHLALQYWKRPDLTKLAFIETGQQRIYRTGDYGRLLANGDIAFLERCDEQVKIRGFRIELREIQAHLESYPDVKQCIVLTQHEGDEKSLIAYLVVKIANSLHNQQQILRNFLQERLPDFMIPSEFVIVESIPLTASGKVNKNALLATKINFLPNSQHVPPRTALEKTLATIWSEELKINQDKISIHDNFFSLGGHSLLVIKIRSRIRISLGIELPLGKLFDYPTIESLSIFLQHSQSIEELPLQKEIDSLTQQSDVEINRFSQKSPQYSLSFEEYRKLLVTFSDSRMQAAQPGSLIAMLNGKGKKPPIFWCGNDYKEQRILHKYLDPEQPFFIMYSGTHTLSNRTEDTYQALANYYVEEIRKIQPSGPYRIGGNCAGAIIATGIALKLWSQGEFVERLCLMEYFCSRLYNYPGKLLLLYGKESHLHVYKSFCWGERDWKKSFKAIPQVDFIPGIHGSFFTEPNIQSTVKKIMSFFSHDPQFFAKIKRLLSLKN